MSLSPKLRSSLRQKLYQYEGKFNHLYLDTKGKVTVGVGHLISNRSAVSGIRLYNLSNKIPSQVATLPQKQLEYDRISKLPWGQRYGAASFKRYTTLAMKDADIDLLLDKHIDSFYAELRAIYSKRKGYAADFDNLHQNVQLALFDMIFNLGAHKEVHAFPRFNAAVKAEDWRRAGVESNRPDVSPARNLYVSTLLQTAPSTP